MTDHKFTDEEIKTGLRCLSGEIILCKFCAFSHLEDRGFACKKNVASAALALINRQKAEIERLEKSLVDQFDGYENIRKKAKAEAVKEFAREHREIILAFCDDDDQISLKVCEYDANTNNLVKEMTGETE